MLYICVSAIRNVIDSNARVVRSREQSWALAFLSGLLVRSPHVPLLTLSGGADGEGAFIALFLPQGDFKRSTTSTVYWKRGICSRCRPVFSHNEITQLLHRWACSKIEVAIDLVTVLAKSEGDKRSTSSRVASDLISSFAMMSEGDKVA